jgi:hypothetical protein
MEEVDSGETLENSPLPVREAPVVDSAVASPESGEMEGTVQRSAKQESKSQLGVTA